MAEQEPKISLSQGQKLTINREMKNQLEEMKIPQEARMIGVAFAKIFSRMASGGEFNDPLARALLRAKELKLPDELTASLDQEARFLVSRLYREWGLGEIESRLPVLSPESVDTRVREYQIKLRNRKAKRLISGSQRASIKEETEDEWSQFNYIAFDLADPEEVRDFDSFRLFARQYIDDNTELKRNFSDEQLENLKLIINTLIPSPHRSFSFQVFLHRNESLDRGLDPVMVQRLGRRIKTSYLMAKGVRRLRALTPEERQKVREWPIISQEEEDGW